MLLALLAEYYETEEMSPDIRSTLILAFLLTVLSDTPSCPFPYGILVPLATQALSGLWAARSLQGTTSTTLLQGSTTAATWYAYGVAASVAHMLFAPLTIPHVKEITRGAPDVDDDHNIKHEVSWEEEQKVEERNRNAQGKWLWVHVLRTVVADVPAMVFFAKGFGEAFM